MKPGTILTIARKELRDTLRDRRTLVFMMLLPIVVMPLLMLGLSKFVMQQSRERATRTLTVAISPAGETTLRALALDWFQANRLALAVVEGKAGVEAVGGFDQLGEMLKQGSGEPPDEEQVANMATILKAALELPEEEKLLRRDAGALFNLLFRSEFVDPSELEPGGPLAQGVEIPEGLPPELADETVASAVQDKRISAAIHVPSDALLTLEEAEEAVPVHILYDSSQRLSEEVYDRLDAFFAAVNRHALKVRLDERALPRDFHRPVDLEDANVATASRKVQAVLGGLLPYLLFAFCFFGALYPALDVTAGEKERFTMETLLLGPISRLDIAVGKFLVVFTAALVAAVLTTTSMAVTFTQGILPAEVASTFEIEFQPLALLLTGSLVLPVAALYSSLLLAVGLYARSFKEAQSYTVPLQFLLVLPTMVSLIPDVETESHLAWIPFVNISLLMKELLKGNYLWGFYGITLASTLVLTVLSLLVAAWMFRRESVLLRA